MEPTLSDLRTIGSWLIGIQVLSGKSEAVWRNEPIKEGPDQLVPSVAPLFCRYGNKLFPHSSLAPAEQQPRCSLMWAGLIHQLVEFTFPCFRLPKVLSHASGAEQGTRRAATSGPRAKGGRMTKGTLAVSHTCEPALVSQASADSRLSD